MKVKILFIASLGILSFIQTSLSFADNANGKNLYSQRCAMCHGADLKGTGPLAIEILSMLLQWLQVGCYQRLLKPLIVVMPGTQC